MNKTKEAYKEVIVEFVVDNYVELDNEISASQGCMSETILNEKFSALKYMKNLVRNLTAESEEDINLRLKEGYDRFYKNEVGD